MTNLNKPENFQKVRFFPSVKLEEVFENITRDDKEQINRTDYVMPGAFLALSFISSNKCLR